MTRTPVLFYLLKKDLAGACLYLSYYRYLKMGVRWFVCLRGNLQEKEKRSVDADNSKVRLTSKSVSLE